MKITKKHVQKLIQTIDAGLCSGVGEPIPGRMCVEAAVCYNADRLSVRGEQGRAGALVVFRPFQHPRGDEANGTYLGKSPSN